MTKSIQKINEIEDKIRKVEEEKCEDCGSKENLGMVFTDTFHLWCKKCNDRHYKESGQEGLEKFYNSIGWG